MDINEREKKLDDISVDLDKKERVFKVYSEEVDEKEKKPIKEYEIYEKKSKRLQTDIKNIELVK